MRTIREQIEYRERMNLSEWATLSVHSMGRRKPEDKDETRTCFMVDRDRILYSNAFKRLKDKTQVWIRPNNDHFENRLSHTLQVAQLARTMAVAMNLNETLAEAGALCHDIAHCCFGHAGGDALDRCFKHRGGWEHELEAERRLNVLENGKNGAGLNISIEVIDAAMNHSGLDNNPRALTKEGKLLPYADKIAYLTSDFDNALKSGVIKGVPDRVGKVLGYTKRDMIQNMVNDVIEQSIGISNVVMSDRVLEASIGFKEFMYAEVYVAGERLNNAKRAGKIVSDLYGFLLANPEYIPRDYVDDVERNIVDYISSMTDSYCMREYTRHFLF